MAEGAERGAKERQSQNWPGKNLFLHFSMKIKAAQFLFTNLWLAIEIKLFLEPGVALMLWYPYLLTICNTSWLPRSRLSLNHWHFSLFSVSPGRLLTCHINLPGIYGEYFIIRQYLPHAAELLFSSQRKLSPSLESGCIGCVILLQHVMPLLKDSTLMEHLQVQWSFWEISRITVIRFLGWIDIWILNVIWPHFSYYYSFAFSRRGSSAVYCTQFSSYAFRRNNASRAAHKAGRFSRGRPWIWCANYHLG